MGFSRQGYWSGLSFPSPGHLPNPGIEPRSPTLQADALPSEPPGKPSVFLVTKNIKMGGGMGEGIVKEFGMDMHTKLIFKMDNQKNNK